jgi:hypothetical protein
MRLDMPLKRADIESEVDREVNKLVDPIRGVIDEEVLHRTDPHEGRLPTFSAILFLSRTRLKQK